MERIIGLICFLSSLCSCSPSVDELSDDLQDDLTCRLVWSGDMERFTLDDKGLRLHDKEGVGSSAFLATPSSQLRGTRWEFRVHLFFNPSVNNYARFYLASSSQKLSGALNGYFLQIGGSRDQVSLYRQEGVETVLLASGRESMKDHNSPELRIKVECDDNGYWTFWTCLEEEADYVKEKQVRDATFNTSAYAGVFCCYTASRCNGFLFSQVRIDDDVVGTTTNPEEPELPEEPDRPENPGQPDKPESMSGMLLFNEVMYDCANDGCEYVELYNNSQKTINLSTIRLGKQREDGSYMSKTLLFTGSTVGGEVAPGGYACFAANGGTLKKKHHTTKAKLYEISNFPALNNNGGILVLLGEDSNNKEVVMDRCRFSNTMHDASKRARGISLEKRSPTLASTKITNWRSSVDETGGTPGMCNSVFNQ